MRRSDRLWHLILDKGFVNYYSELIKEYNKTVRFELSVSFCMNSPKVGAVKI